MDFEIADFPFLKRELYVNRFLPFLDKNIIKILTGHRRVGKSYMLFQIIEMLREKGIKPEQIIYINKELAEFASIKNHKDLLSYIEKLKRKKKQKIYLFIDEVQEIEKFETALRSLLAENLYDIYCTGSNANILSGELATNLAGRYIEFKIYSLSYPEFLNFHKLKNNKDSLLQYFKFGGLPFLIHLELKEEIVSEYMRNIYNTILLKDVVARYQLRNVAFLERLLKYLADNTGSLVSAKSISDFLKSQRVNISPNVILNYISYLENAFIIFKVQRAEVGGRKIFEIGEKYYFEEIGIRRTLLNSNISDIHKVLENIIYLHLRIAGYEVRIGKLDNKEIDFVCSRKDEKLYIQVAYLIPDAKTFEREFGNLLLIKDNFPKYVVSMDERAEGNHNGIKHIHIQNFLIRIIKDNLP